MRPSSAERGGRREDARAASGVYGARAPVRREQIVVRKSQIFRACEVVEESRSGCARVARIRTSV